MKAIQLYWRNQYPNALKVLIIFEELGLPYEFKCVDPQYLKQEPFSTVNPNGHVPVIRDLNTDVILFGSNAIMGYLIATYDTAYVLTYPPSSSLNHQITQWSYFQASCQGPYFTQFAWFHIFHEDKLPWAQSHWGQEILHVVGGLNRMLKDKDWLTGSKCTWADLAFVPWNLHIDFLMKASGGAIKWDKKAFPEFTSWQERMLLRAGVKRAIAKTMLHAMNSNATGEVKK